MIRNAQATREKLVRVAYEQIHEYGFQGMRVDQVLKQAGLQKGAFYHHFNSKTTLAYAVIEEEIKGLLETVWLKPIKEMNNPVTDLPNLIKTLSKRATPLMQQHGCPLNNLAQEMSNLDDGFRQRIQANFKLWINTLTDKFEEAKLKKHIKNDIDCETVAHFVIATIEGCISLSKVEKTKKPYDACQSQLSLYLQSLAAN